MTEQEFERAFLARWGFPSWNQYLREQLAVGVSERDAFHAYTVLSREAGKRSGLVD